MKVFDKISFIAVTLLVCASVSLNSARAGSFTFTRDISLGARGDDVSALQQFLISGGFLNIPAPTGYFGPLTKATLSAWQAQAGIYPSSGFFGPVSRGKINIVAAAAAGTTSPSVANKVNGSPVRLKIPKLNVDAGFQYNGIKDGVMEIPNNIVDVGWFTGSVHPGEKGVAIVTGHVAQIRGGIMTKPGVFYNLSELRAGDTIDVLNDKGESVTFVVRESRSYDPTADATDVFTSKDGGAHLNLITCEGTWNPAKTSFSQRLVVFADAAKQ